MLLYFGFQFSIMFTLVLLNLLLAFQMRDDIFTSSGRMAVKYIPIHVILYNKSDSLGPTLDFYKICTGKSLTL